MEANSVSHAMYTPTKIERVTMIKPADSNIMKGEGHMGSRTVSHDSYAEVKGERYDVQIPKDSNLLKGEGRFEDKSRSHEDFVGHRREVAEYQASAMLNGNEQTEPTTGYVAVGLL